MLDREGMEHFKATFVRLAREMKSPEMQAVHPLRYSNPAPSTLHRWQESAELMENMSLDTLEGGPKAKKYKGGRGMSLVYKRLKQLTDDTLTEAKADAEEMVKARKVPRRPNYPHMAASPTEDAQGCDSADSPQLLRRVVRTTSGLPST
jgi:hypothetical protein